MFDFFDMSIENLIVHQVGNKSEEEGMVISENEVKVSDELNDTLLAYFKKPFEKSNELFQFVHEVDLSYNEVKGICEKIFTEPSEFIPHSKELIKHLYDQSDHPKIKPGDVLVVHFDGVMLYDEIMNAIGIFKVENKDAFLKLLMKEGSMGLLEDEGISLEKTDKACLIMNTDGPAGYMVLSVDQNRSDAQYWREAFLGIDYHHDKHFETKNCLEMVRSFSNKVIKEEDGKKEEIRFLSEAVQYFEEEENLDINQFAESVFPEERQRAKFAAFKTDYEENNQFAFSEVFEISKPLVDQQKKKIKNYIKLDTGIQIKLDQKNPESANKFIEKGFDDLKQMSYYKVYFNKEVN